VSSGRLASTVALLGDGSRWSSAETIQLWNGPAGVGRLRDGDRARIRRGSPGTAGNYQSRDSVRPAVLRTEPGTDASGSSVLLMVWREWCRSEAYERVVRLQTSSGRGAAFTIDRNGRQWLITARHLLPADEPAPECVLSRGAFRTTLRLGFLADPGGEGDVAVAPLQSPFTPQLDLHATSEGLMWSQIVYFLGFPYGMATDVGTPGQEIAFVKQAIVSASRRILTNPRSGTSTATTTPGSRAAPLSPAPRNFGRCKSSGRLREPIV
jgi:hypothetical protein